MQTISGIHYNSSVPDALWQHLGITEQTRAPKPISALFVTFDAIRGC